MIKLTMLFKKEFAGWARAKGLRFLVEITLDHLIYKGELMRVVTA